MKEYQFATFDKDYNLIHAGVHKLGRFSKRTIIKLERKWLHWRYNYINTHPGNYPLRNTPYNPKYIYIYPIDSPKDKIQYIFS